MSVSDAILSILDAEPTQPSSQTGVVRGRTLIQKKMYFLSVLADEDFGFRPHFYGPYSSMVSTALGTLIEADFIEETRFPYGISTDFGEMNRFDYSLSESGQCVVSQRPEVVSPFRPYVDKINDSGIASDINTISIAAKVHFILADQGESTIVQIRKQADNLGWNISRQSVDRVVAYLEGLDLVTSE